MGEKINVGVIGSGHIAKNVLCPDAAKIDGFNLYAFCDVMEERAQELCDQYQGEYATTDAQKILTLATQRAEGPKKTVKSNELQVLQQCVQLAEKDEWEAANELIDKSLAFK